jgi:hypothetical protein
MPTDFTCRHECTDMSKVSESCKAEMNQARDLCMFTGTTYPGGACGVEVIPLPEPDGGLGLLVCLIAMVWWERRRR